MFPAFLLIWTGLIFAIKIANVVLEYVLHKRIAAFHTLANKITGFVLFLLPFTLNFAELKYSGSTVCIAASFAAIHEGYLVIKKGKC